MSELHEFKIDSIIVEDRYRKDMGELEELVESIKAKGILQPITVNQTMHLIAGGRRLAAAKLAGLTVIPGLIHQGNYLSGMDSRLDALEIELHENIFRKDFHWAERAALEQEIFNRRKALNPTYQQKDHSTDNNQSEALTSKRLQLASALESFPELKEQATEKDAWKALKRMEEQLVRNALVEAADAKALTGVKIAQSNYKIGDALDGLRGLKSGAYHFCEVDPPYAVDLVTVKTRKTGTDDNVASTYTEWNAETYEQNIRIAAAECYRILGNDGYVVWWHGASWYTQTLKVLREVGFHTYDIPGIWYKGAQGETANPDQMLASCYEQFFVARKGNPKLAKVARANVFHYAPVASQNKTHTTEKPIDLLVDILETFTYPGSRIVVPFLGSGVTLRACYKTGRIGFGWDLSQEHKDAFIAKVAKDELEAHDATNAE